MDDHFIFNSIQLSAIKNNFNYYQGDKMNGIYTMYKDQYNNIFYSSTLKELKEQVKGKVSKMYSTDKENNTFHVGYVIGDHWLFAFIPLRKKC